MKVTFYGDSENLPKPDQCEALADCLFKTDLLVVLLENIEKLEFEARKDIAFVYNYLLRNHKQEAVEYVKAHVELLNALTEGYSKNEIALSCGSIFRELLRHEELCSIMLYSKLFNKFFDLLHLPIFDVSSDAFGTLKLMLTKHKKLACKYLETNFDAFFGRYCELLKSDNYVTKRLALKLLAELLLSRDNFTVMMRFINMPEHLKLIMQLLRGTTRAIQLEAFHVFKIFVANPKKSDPVRDILYRNRTKLIDFLTRFQRDKEDEQFADERNILLQALQDLEPPSSHNTTNMSSTSSSTSSTSSTSSSSSNNTNSGNASGASNGDAAPVLPTTTSPSLSSGTSSTVPTNASSAPGVPNNTSHATNIGNIPSNPE